MLLLSEENNAKICAFQTISELKKIITELDHEIWAKNLHNSLEYTNNLSPKNVARRNKRREEKIVNLEDLSTEYKKELKQLPLNGNNLKEQL